MCAYTFVWESGFTNIPQLFCYESILIVSFTVSNTSSNTIPFVNYFLGCHLVYVYMCIREYAYYVYLRDSIAVGVYMHVLSLKMISTVGYYAL